MDSQNKIFNSRELRPLAELLTVFAAMIMIYYGFSGVFAYISSVSYYNTRVFQPALYIGIWNICTFPFTLAAGIFLFKKKHFLISMGGVILALLSGFVPIIALSYFSGYDWTNGLWLGAPLLFLSVVSLIFVTSSNKLNKIHDMQ